MKNKQDLFEVAGIGVFARDDFRSVHYVHLQVKYAILPHLVIKISERIFAARDELSQRAWLKALVDADLVTPRLSQQLLTRLEPSWDDVEVSHE